MKLNIGCGFKKRRGYINIDINPKCQPDIVMDIEKGFPKNWTNKFSYIYSKHCLEHIRPDKWEFVLDEIARVAKHRCCLVLDLPFDSIRTRGNVNHYRTFNYGAFDQLNINSRDYSKLRLKNNKPAPKWKKIFYYMFPILKYNIHFEFEVIK